MLLKAYRREEMGEMSMIVASTDNRIEPVTVTTIAPPHHHENAGAHSILQTRNLRADAIAVGAALLHHLAVLVVTMILLVGHAHPLALDLHHA